MTDAEFLKERRALFIKDATEILAEIRVRLFGDFQHRLVRDDFDRRAESYAGAIWDAAIEGGALEIVRKAEAEIAAQKGAAK